MDLIYYLKLRFITMLSWRTNKSGIITFIITIFGVCLNINFINEIVKNDIFLINKERILFWLLICIFTGTIFRVFILNYSPLRNFVPIYIPVNNIKRFAFNMASNIVNVYFFVGIFMVFYFKLTAENNSIENIFIAKYIFIVFYAVILRRVIQALFEKRIKRQYITLAIFTGFSCVILAYFCLFITNIFANIVVQFFLFVCLYFVEKNHIYANFIINQKSYKKISLMILYGNQLSRISLIIGTMFKIFILFTITYSYYLKGKYPSHYIVYLFLLPTFPFTYVFNNTWGILKSTWYNVDIANGKGSFLFKQLLTLLLLPLSIDFIISCLFISFNPKFLIDGALSYFTSTLLFSVLSFYWSLIFIIPQQEKWSINTRNTTSIVASFFTITIAALLSLTYFSYYFRLIYVFWAILSYILFTHIDDFYQNRRKKIFEVLFKN